MQLPPENSGFDSFEFWCPNRRPDGQNIAMKIFPALNCFPVKNIVNGFTRPYIRTNAWAAGLKEIKPGITLEWDEPVIIHSITIFFDTDFDHPMESLQMGHPEDVIPFCVKSYRILNDAGYVLYENSDNHQTINRWVPEKEFSARSIKFDFDHPDENVPDVFKLLIQAGSFDLFHGSFVREISPEKIAALYELEATAATLLHALTVALRSIEAVSTLSPEKAFIEWLITGDALVKALAQDPLLPPALLPETWPASELRQIFSRWNALYLKRSSPFVHQVLNK